MSEDYVCIGEGSARSQRAGVSQTDRSSVWTERMVQALATREHWFSLYDKVTDEATLWRGWCRVAANAGAAGVDRISVEQFARTALTHISRLSQMLKTDTYRPQAIRRVEIDKVDGGRRPLGIPTVLDRVVQSAMLEVLEPIFESRFAPVSYGFRPGRGCKDALRDVQQALHAGLVHVVDADLKGYFDSIPHDRLLARVHERIKDRSVMRLIERFLGQEVMSEAACRVPEMGTPQGAVLSPLLANLYLHPLDELLMRHGFRMVRYADDFVVMCATEQAATAALSLIRAWVEGNGLTLHPEKTRIADLGRPAGYFDFLGYRFYADDSGKLRRTIKPKKQKALRRRLAQLTRRVNGHSTEHTIERLNRWLAGVFAYFKHAERRVLATLDAHVRFRLRRIYTKRHGLSGNGKTWRIHRLWPNTHFVALGLFSLAANRDALLLHSQGGNT
jgi:RNA-directed DNA polymerase